MVGPGQPPGIGDDAQMGDGPAAMALSIQCPGCRAVLNLPDGAAGRRMRCPKCAERFYADGPASANTPLAQPATGGAPAVDRARPASGSLPDLPMPKAAAPSTKAGHGDLDLPTATGDLRDTFALPLLMEDDEPKASKPPGTREADALALFDEKPRGPRRPSTAGDARANDRRCPTCGFVVPRGMSLCSSCGLDLDTGTRFDVDEMLDEAPPPPPRPSLPIGVGVVGVTMMLASVVLGVAALVIYAGGKAGEQSWGYLLLATVCGFGIYASYKFLARRSLKLLLIALGLGLAIDVLGLIAVPVFVASVQVVPEDLEAAPVDPGVEAPLDPNFDPEAPPRIKPVAERLDQRQVSWGIAIMLGIAGVFVYVTTPGVRRHFDRDAL